jgi:hypothetical protein
MSVPIEVIALQRMDPSVVELKIRRTIVELRAAQPRTIYYARHTGWWATELPYRLRGQFPLPCDPRGSVLLETDDIVGFFAAAEANAAHYGRYGMRALEAALHGNLTTPDGRPTSLASWDGYNLALYKLDRGLITRTDEEVKG